MHIRGLAAVTKVICGRYYPPVITGVLLLGLASLLMPVATPYGAASTGGGQTGQGQSRPFAPGKCGPVDPTYIRTANLSGGMPLFLQPSELGQISSLIGAGLSSNTDGVLWATGKLAGRPREFEVPIDSTVKEANFAFSFDTQGNTVTLLRPSGAAVVAGEQGVEIGEWRCGRIFNVTVPESGFWRVQLKGSGTFWARVQQGSAAFVVQRCGTSAPPDKSKGRKVE